MDNIKHPGAIALIALMVLLLTTTAYALRQVQITSQQNHDTICRVLDGYKQQYKSTQKYIADHRDRAEFLGLKEIRASQVQLKRRIDSFGDAGC